MQVASCGCITEKSMWYGCYLCFKGKNNHLSPLERINAFNRQHAQCAQDGVCKIGNILECGSCSSKFYPDKIECKCVVYDKKDEEEPLVTYVTYNFTGKITRGQLNYIINLDDLNKNDVDVEGYAPRTEFERIIEKYPKLHVIIKIS